MFKICKTCQIEKDVSHFHSNASAKDGLDIHCKPCRLAKRKKYYHNNLEKLNKIRNKSRATAKGRAGMMFRDVKRRARIAGYEFNLTVEFIYNAINDGFCQATGIPFDLNSASDTFRNPFSPSLDRRDNSKGYTTDNVQVVCIIYNVGKSEYEEAVFEQMCLAVAEKVKRRERGGYLW